MLECGLILECSNGGGGEGWMGVEGMMGLWWELLRGKE